MFGKSGCLARAWLWIPQSKAGGVWGKICCGKREDSAKLAGLDTGLGIGTGARQAGPFLISRLPEQHSSCSCSLRRWKLRHEHMGWLLEPVELLRKSDSCSYLQINSCSLFACTLQSVHCSGRKKTAESSQEGFQSRRFHSSSVLLVQTPSAQPHYSSSPSTKLGPLLLIRSKKSTILGFFSELLMIKEIVGNSCDVEKSLYEILSTA